jgi:hypothetical protein
MLKESEEQIQRSVEPPHIIKRGPELAGLDVPSEVQKMAWPNARHHRLNVRLMQEVGTMAKYVFRRADSFRKHHVNLHVSVQQRLDDMSANKTAPTCQQNAFHGL